MNTRAFTLVELLVVVAISAVLLGLLLPALGSARAASAQSSCASNIRQLAAANDLYAADHDDHYAPGAPGIAGPNLRRWHGSRARRNEPFTPRGGPITTYLDADDTASPLGVRECPTFASVVRDLARRGRGFERSAGGYGYNNAFVGVTRAPGTVAGVTIWRLDTDQLGARRCVFRRPAGTLAFTDAALAADELIEYSFAEPVFWPDIPGARPDPSIHFRHRRLASIAWLDGHVTAETRARTHASGLYDSDPDSLMLGWFGDAGGNSLFAPY